MGEHLDNSSLVATRPEFWYRAQMNAARRNYLSALVEGHKDLDSRREVYRVITINALHLLSGVPKEGSTDA